MTRLCCCALDCSRCLAIRIVGIMLSFAQYWLYGACCMDVMKTILYYTNANCSKLQEHKKALQQIITWQVPQNTLSFDHSFVLEYPSINFQLFPFRRIINIRPLIALWLASMLFLFQLHKTEKETCDFILLYKSF